VIILPAIDLREGQCVRLYQGDFDRQTKYSKEPLTLAREYEAMGLSELHIVDLDGARSGHQQNQEIVSSIVAATDLTIQLGGGIRNESDLETWLNSGVTRAIIGSLAVTQTDVVKGWLAKYGPDRIVLALDVMIGEDSVPRVTTHGWTRSSEKTLWQCIDEYLPAGLKHVLCTDISRDGAMTGPSVELYAQVIERYPDILLQASGGVRNMGDIDALGRIGAHSGICGRALLDGKISAAEIKTFLLAA
jgi:phosphoribosylformimino-5-aminoimidazole carboxamide ribotide isomerase